ncbi:MAG: choice-of-anchor D domain-containing protein, partial [Chloroflexi bacterium]|nr:choice-of-anchor D domain-containing protein [Chloroflexota bacterium]
GGVSANFIARWDTTTSTWAALGTGLDSAVYALAVSGSDLYVGGFFTTAGGVSAKNIARWDGSSWAALGTGLSTGVDDFVNALAVSGSDLYVGGYFSTAGGMPANNIARWDTTTSTWAALGTGLSGPVYALAVSGSDLYVGGYFTTAGGKAAHRVALARLSYEIAVQGNDSAIANGDSTPTASDGTDFGTVAVSGAAITRTFTISNSGNAALTLGANAVTLGGAGSNYFAVSSQPSATLPADATTRFVLSFHPTSAGAFSATVAIANNDPDENPYTFVIQGVGLAEYTLTPAMAGTGSGTVSLDPPGGTYIAGTVVTVTATPATGSTFTGWSGTCSGTGLCAVTMDANQGVTANFTLAAPRIAVSVAREGAATVTAGTVVTYQVTITNVGPIAVVLTSIQGTPQPLAQNLTAAEVQQFDAPCAAPLTLAVGAVQRCTFTWTAAGNNGQQVNFVVTANGTANGQAATVSVSGFAPVLISVPTALGENNEPQRIYIFLPLAAK